MTYYSENGYGKIGDNIRNKILNEEKEIRKNQRLLSKRKNKKGNKINKKNIIKRIRRRYEKIKNIVKELHNKTALFLCKKYERILIPKFETSNMVKNDTEQKKESKKKSKKELKKELKKETKTRRLNGRVKFVLNMLSHYKFKQHLINKGNEYGCEITEVTEENTSKACTKCGKKSDTYKKRQKECEHCKYKIDRDINGSRNILIKNVKVIKSRASIVCP